MVNCWLRACELFPFGSISHVCLKVKFICQISRTQAAWPGCHSCPHSHGRVTRVPKSIVLDWWCITHMSEAQVSMKQAYVFTGQTWCNTRLHKSPVVKETKLFFLKHWYGQWCILDHHFCIQRHYNQFFHSESVMSRKYMMYVNNGHVRQRNSNPPFGQCSLSDHSTCNTEDYIACQDYRRDIKRNSQITVTLFCSHHTPLVNVLNMLFKAILTSLDSCLWLPGQILDVSAVSYASSYKTETWSTPNCLCGPFSI